jgi:hypothetical protein
MKCTLQQGCGNSNTFLLYKVFLTSVSGTPFSRFLFLYRLLERYWLMVMILSLTKSKNPIQNNIFFLGQMKCQLISIVVFNVLICKLVETSIIIFNFYFLIKGSNIVVYMWIWINIVMHFNHVSLILRQHIWIMKKKLVT